MTDLSPHALNRRFRNLVDEGVLATQLGLPAKDVEVRGFDEFVTLVRALHVQKEFCALSAVHSNDPVLYMETWVKELKKKLNLATPPS